MFTAKYWTYLLLLSTMLTACGPQLEDRGKGGDALHTAPAGNSIAQSGQLSGKQSILLNAVEAVAAGTLYKSMPGNHITLLALTEHKSHRTAEFEKEVNDALEKLESPYSIRIEDGAADHQDIGYISVDLLNRASGKVLATAGEQVNNTPFIAPPDTASRFLDSASVKRILSDKGSSDHEKIISLKEELGIKSPTNTKNSK